NQMTRIGEPKAAVKFKDHDSCLLVHWVHMDMQAVLNDLQIMDVDVGLGENGWHSATSIANIHIVSGTSNWTQAGRLRVQVYECPPPRLRRTFRFRWLTTSLGPL
ncbi:hypothetical protein K443DRAFT_679887, partial [Laccaria amethystina LaAM-08-1]